MSSRNTKDWRIVAMLLLGGIALAALGFRAWTLERQDAAHRARQRAETELRAARKWAAQLIDPKAHGAPIPIPPEYWLLDDGTPQAPPDLNDPVVLAMAEADHLLTVRNDAVAAMAVYEPMLDVATPYRFVVALHAGRAAMRLGDAERAIALWREATGAPPNALHDGISVRALALFHICLRDLAQGRIPSLLSTCIGECGQGHYIETHSGLQRADLLTALAAQASDMLDTPALRELRDAAARGRDGLFWAATFPDTGIFLTADKHLIRRSLRVIQRMPISWLALKNPSVRVRHFMDPMPPGALTGNVPNPLHMLFFDVTPVVPGMPGALALLGTLVGLMIYTLGAFFAVSAMRRSRRTARMQNDFVASVSHELKTPIASVRAMAELLGDGVADNPTRTRQYAERIEHEMQRLGATVRNVLDVSRIEQTGRLPVTLTMGDPAPVLELVAASFAPLLERRGFVFSVVAQPATALVPLDKEALRGVIVNLLDNAAKYSTGEVKEITLTGTALASGYRIEVADRGMGIDASEARALFERLHRSDKAGEAALPGVGLGLHVVQEVVRAHHGSVEAAPRPKGGSVFTVTLRAEGNVS